MKRGVRFRKGGNMHFRQQAICLTFLIFPLLLSNPGVAADRFYISIPGPTLSYAHLYYGQEKGFFAQEQLDLHVLVVRGVIGVSSLMSGEIDVTCQQAAVWPLRSAACPSK